MELFDPVNSVPQPVDPENFTGSATLERIDNVCENPSINIYRVTFQPKARTAWHSHSGPQILLILEGCCRIQKAGEHLQEIETGGTVCISPGEKHWHGATEDSAMTHIALNINATTEWFEHVDPEDYNGCA
jgi:quercetin dioxygenase-like cupin family protein